MMQPARRDRYTLVAIGLHWLIAAGIAAQLVLGIVMTQAKLPVLEKFQCYQLHKSIGITVLLLVLVRIAWRLSHPAPPLPASLPPLERGAAHGTHHLLYFLMLAMPLTGWALVSASVFNIPTVLYGIIPWPHLPVLPTLADKKPVEDALKTAHGLLGWAIIAMLALHVGAALRHALKRDGLFARMLPWTRRVA